MYAIKNFMIGVCIGLMLIGIFSIIRSCENKQKAPSYTYTLIKEEDL